jgi:hypothetical protein
LPDGVGRVGAEGAAGRHVGTHAALGGFFGHDGLAEQAQAGAAMVLRRAHAPQADGARLGLQGLQRVGRQLVGIVLGTVLGRLDFGRHEAGHRVLDLAELLGEFPAVCAHGRGVVFRVGPGTTRRVCRWLDERDSD